MTPLDDLKAEEEADIVQTMAHAQGRRVLYRILKMSECLERPGAFDPTIMAYREGQRAIGFELLTDILKHCPKKFTVMILEAQERAKDRQRKAKHGENYE